MNEILLTIIEVIMMPIVAFIVGLFMVLMMRKLAARLQRRIGPPLFQPLYDIIKLYGKQTQISHGLIHDIGIIMAVGGYVAAEALLPVPGMDGIAAKGGLVTLAYLTMVPSLGLALGVGQCANPNGSIGISRALTSMLAYDIPFIIVVFGVAYHFSSTNLVSIIATQQAGGISTWGISEMPVLALAGLFALHAFALSITIFLFEILTSSIDFAFILALQGPILSIVSKAAAIIAVSVLSKEEGIIISPLAFPAVVFKFTSILPIFPFLCNSLNSNSEPKSPSVWPKIAPITSGLSTVPSTEIST